jgi:di/tricarboxylate transporter
VRATSNPTEISQEYGRFLLLCLALPTSVLLLMVIPDAPQNSIRDNACNPERLNAELKINSAQLIAAAQGFASLQNFWRAVV